MPTAVGPNTFGEENLVLAFDQDNFPHGWGLNQLFPDSEMKANTFQGLTASSVTSGNYLGEFTTPQMTGNSMIFSGGDLSNYWATNPEYRGWDNGAIGSTGGNWFHSHNILPTTADASRDFIVECRWRFYYVSKTGNGTLNPRFQIGRAYNELYHKTFDQVGNSYDWQYSKFRVNGADGAGSNTSYTFTFGLTSADSAIEIDYMRVYEVTKPTGLVDYTGNHSINVANTSINYNGNITFDGSNDYLQFNNGVLDGTGDFTIEAVIQADATETGGTIFGNYPSGNLQVFYGKHYIGMFLANNSTYLGTSPWTDAVRTDFTTDPVHILAMRAGGVTTFYINGQLKKVGASTSTIGSTSAVFRSGTNTSTTEQFNGDIHLLKVYNRSLTASEIKANYNAIKGRFNI